MKRYLLLLLLASLAKSQGITPANANPNNVQGNGNKFQLSLGTVTPGNCAQFDANGNLVSSPLGPCGTGGGGGGGGLGDPGSNGIVFRSALNTTRVALVADFPLLNQNTIGSAGSLSGTLTQCTGNTFAQGIQANGNANCATPSGAGNVSGPGLSTNGFVPVWNGITGTLLGTGIGVSITPTPNTILEAGASGQIAVGWVPILNQNTTGTSSNVTGVVLPINGGTGTAITVGVAGHVLRSNALAYVDSAIQVNDVPLLNQNTTGNAGTANALSGSPVQCTGGQFATGIVANGNANCGTPATAPFVYHSYSGTSSVDFSSFSAIKVTASGSNPTVTVAANPASNIPIWIGLCNDTTARTWSIPSNWKQISAPQDASQCSYNAAIWDGTNYQGTGADSTPLLIEGAERAATGTPAVGLTALWPDSTRHTWASLSNNNANVHIMPRTAGSTDQLASADLSDTANIDLLNANQTFTGNKIFTGSLTASGATHTIPEVVAATAGALPASCTTGELGFVTSSTAGQQIYECNSGVWTQQSGGGTGGGTAFTDQTTYGFRDDFVTNNLVPSGGVCTGEAAYECTTTGSMTLHGIVAVTNHAGILECSSSATNPSACNVSSSVDIQSAVNNAIPNLTGIAGWKFVCVFNLHQNSANQEFVCGLSNGINHLPSNGIYIRFDNVTPFSDTNFSLVCAQAGSYSPNSLGVAPSNTWHTAIIQPGTNANTIKVTFDGTTTDNLCDSSHIPTTNLNLVFAYSNANTTAGNLADIDFWAFQMPLTR